MLLAPLVVPRTLALEYYRRDLENRVCRPVTRDDLPKLPELIQKMAKFATEEDGVGLAAPQVGLYIQLAIMMMEPKRIKVMINPRLLIFGGRDIIDHEGCLSLPPAQDNTARVTRSEFVTIEAGTLADPDACVRTEHAGMEARVVQHEIDHLHGIFFINRAKAISREIVLRKYEHFMQSRLNTL